MLRSRVGWERDHPPPEEFSKLFKDQGGNTEIEAYHTSVKRENGTDKCDFDKSASRHGDILFSGDGTQHGGLCGQSSVKTIPFVEKKVESGEGKSQKVTFSVCIDKCWGEVDAGFENEKLTEGYIKSGKKIKNTFPLILGNFPHMSNGKIVQFYKI